MMLPIAPATTSKTRNPEIAQIGAIVLPSLRLFHREIQVRTSPRGPEGRG
jgi:hypothetical protein